MQSPIVLCLVFHFETHHSVYTVQGCTKVMVENPYILQSNLYDHNMHRLRRLPIIFKVLNY